MRDKRKYGMIGSACVSVCLLFFSSGAFAAPVTENECLHAGGYVTEGSGCKFCVGGKLDLAEIKDSGKKSPSRAETEKKAAEKSAAGSAERGSGDN